jgi:U3 small nucleolar RNA-associated protein 25
MAFAKRKRPVAKKSGRKESRFASSRLRQSESPEEDEQSLNEEEASEEYSEESEEEAPQNTPTAYQKLLKSFKINLDKEELPRKRRKVETEVTETEAREESGADQLSEGDELDEQTDDESNVSEEEDVLDDGNEQSDPFEAHFSIASSSRLEDRIAAISKGWSSQRVSFGKEKCTLMIPSGLENDNSLTKIHKSSPFEAIKKRLVPASESISKTLPPVEADLSKYIFNYADVFYAGRTPKNASSLRQLVALQVLNHSLKTRDKVLKHNSRLAHEDKNPDLEFKDQGFTRPKVLYLVPTRSSCARVVESLISIFQPEQQENRKRFEDNYVEEDGEVPFDRPEDYKELFEGNDDDMFRVGIKITRKTFKYFAQFYNSDIIIASPLGLRRAIEANE